MKIFFIQLYEKMSAEGFRTGWVWWDGEGALASLILLVHTDVQRRHIYYIHDAQSCLVASVSACHQCRNKTNVFGKMPSGNSRWGMLDVCLGSIFSYF